LNFLLNFSMVGCLNF